MRKKKKEIRNLKKENFKSREENKGKNEEWKSEDFFIGFWRKKNENWREVLKNQKTTVWYKLYFWRFIRIGLGFV